MKLKDRKLEKKEDYKVFKILLRCLKESGFSNAMQYKIKGLNELIYRCYSSRKSHSHEPLFVNIGYWPDDCGSILGCDIFQLLFFSMLFNRFPTQESLEERFILSLRCVVNNPTTQYKEKRALLISYFDEISKALKNTKNCKDLPKNVDILKTVFKGLDEEIPF